MKNIKTKYILISIIMLFSACQSFKKEQEQNVLTTEELNDGWYLLWDGESFEGWRGINKSSFPKDGWIIENGELICLGKELADSLKGSDIITKKNTTVFI